jgi:hypothetical protein
VLCLYRKTFPGINLPKKLHFSKFIKSCLKLSVDTSLVFIISGIVDRYPILKRDNLSGEPLETLCICVRAVVDHSFGISKFRFMGIIICIDINEISDIVLANALTVTPDLFNWHIIKHVCFQQSRPLDIYFENWNR